MKLGVFVPTVGNNQLSVQAVANINTLVDTDNTIYPCIFYKEFDFLKVKLKGIATTFDKLYEYDGHLITTNLDTTFIALKCKRLKSIYFYVTDLEWIRGIGNYLSNISLYQHPKVHVICPSVEYADALMNYCNVKTECIITGFNLNEIVRTIRSGNN